MHRIFSGLHRAGLRAGALLAIVSLGLVSVVGSGGGGAFLLGDCPPGLDCSGAALPVPQVRPQKVTAQVGTPVTFVATTANIPAASVTYQWFRSSDGGTRFAAIAGATSDTLSLPGVNLADDGAIFLATATANGISGSDSDQLAVSKNAGLVFSDGEFQAADWLATARPDGNTPATDHTEELVPSGGHPGAYRKMVFQFAPQAGTGVVAYTSLQATYAPQTQGAIYVIDYSEDGISLETSASRSTASALLLEQGGRRYVAAPAQSYPRLSTVWGISQDTPSLKANDFRLYDGPSCPVGEACPDFSALGAPMRFGYWRFSSGRLGGSVAHGIDNWKVTVWSR